MKIEDLMIFALWAILIVIGVVLLVNIGSVIQAIGNIAAACISALAVLIGAILTHALTNVRDQNNRREIEKQKNYLKLIDRIDLIIRSHNPSDNFSKVHLESWVVGSDRVVELTNELINATDNEVKKAAVKRLLIQMRSEVGLPDLTIDIPLDGLFPRGGGF